MLTPYSGGASAEESARTAYNASIEAKRIAEAQQFKIWQTEQAALRATARAEGRSLIREFTPEEVEQRRQEAEAAAAEERKMLWQLQGGGGEQPQEMVEQRVLEEEENVLPMPPLSAEVVQEVRTPSGVAASEVVTPSVVQEAAPLALLPPCPPPPPTPEELAQAEATATALAAASLAAQTLARDQAAQADADAQQANERAQRVADSMAMYLQQLKQRPEPSASCTWDGQLKQGEEETKGQHKAKGVYWTEEMDLLLAKYVGTCAYDFQDIANRMQVCPAVCAMLCCTHMMRRMVLLCVLGRCGPLLVCCNSLWYAKDGWVESGTHVIVCPPEQRHSPVHCMCVSCSLSHSAASHRLLPRPPRWATHPSTPPQSSFPRPSAEPAGPTWMLPIGPPQHLE